MRKTCFALLLLVVCSPLARAANGTTYTGEAVVRTIDDNRIAVFLDTDGDRIIDNGFLLTSDIPVHSRIAQHFDSAKLTFTDGYVRVSTDKKVYDLQVAGYPDPPAAPKGSDVVTLIGSALTHSRGDSGCDVSRAHEKDAGACYKYGTK